MIPLAQPGPMTEDERFMFDCYGYLIIEDVLIAEGNRRRPRRFHTHP